jgi:hypothetical protein
MFRKSPENCNDSGIASNDNERCEVQNAEARTKELLAFEAYLRTNPDIKDIQARYPQIDDEFVRHVEEFVERYRPALEELAKR